jgi:competence protein ComEC
MRAFDRLQAALAAAARSLAYLVISGTSIAAVRSFIMVSIMFLAIQLDRPTIALRNVALSALIILVLFPESLLDVVFQMWFAAAVALVSAYDVLRVWFGELRAEAYGWLALAGTPFAIYLFHKTRQFAVLANRVAVSICNVVVTPEALPTLVLMQ